MLERTLHRRLLLRHGRILSRSLRGLQRCGGRLPEHVTVSEILDAVDDLDLYGPEAPAESEDPVLHILRRRDHAIRCALEGITLQSLTSGARTSDPNSAAPIPAVPLK